MLPLVAIDFPQFTDGRGYSLARLLRERYGYRGELRAIGDVLRDQFFALAQCGFDAFAIRADRDAADALAGLADFTGVYAPTDRVQQPRHRRCAAAAGAPDVVASPGSPHLVARPDCVAIARDVRPER